MCIVCEIKNKLAISDADAETIGFVLKRAELLGEIAYSVSKLAKLVFQNGELTHRQNEELVELGKLASDCLSDSVEGVARRNAKLAETHKQSENEALFDLIGSLIGLKRRNEAEDEGNPGLPPEVWAAIPAELREMMKGAKVVHLDIADDEALQKLFDAIKSDGQTKH